MIDEVSKESDLEKRSREFLIDVIISKKKFADRFNKAEPEIREFLLNRGYVSDDKMTALGRTYADHYSKK